MALENFSGYANGTTSIPNVTTYEGGYEIQGGELVPTVNRTRIAWPSYREGRWSVPVNPTASESGNAGLLLRGSDASNYLSIFFQSNTGLLRASKYVNASNTVTFTKNVYTYGPQEARELSVEIVGDIVKIYLDGLFMGSYEDDSGLPGSDAGLRTDSVVYHFGNFSYQSVTSPTPAAPTTYTQQGKAFVSSKIGAILSIHSQIQSIETPDEFWPYVVNGADIPNWPSTKYPLILYTSSDHSYDKGGIFVRVYNSELGSMESGDSWEEWQNVSGRPEFGHIAKKTCPIYVDPDFDSCETPTVIVKDGQVKLYYHNSNNDVVGAPYYAQNTSMATGTNGIDFTRQVESILTYNPQYEQGDGHTGYARISAFGSSYLMNSTHGGGPLQRAPTDAIWSSDDLISWDRIFTVGRGQDPDIISEAPAAFDGEEVIHMIHSVKDMIKEGEYWRITFNMRTDIVVGGEDQLYLPFEVLVDEDFNIVSKPNMAYASLGANGTYDAREINNPNRFEYNGKVYAFYKAVSDSLNNSIALMEFSEIDHDWTILRTFADKQVAQSYNASSYAGLTASANTTLSNDGELIEFTMPANGDYVSISGSNETLDDHGTVDLKLVRHGRTEDVDCAGFVGWVDDPSNIQNGVIVRWPFNADSGFYMTASVIQGGEEISYTTRKVTGKNSMGGLSERYESPRAKQDYAIRVYPAERKYRVLDGVSVVFEGDLFGVDTSQALKPVVSFATLGGLETSSVFESMEVITYSNAERQVEAQNQPPVANAGPDQSAAAGARVQLNASMSTDPEDGSVSQFGWEQVDNGADAVVLEFANTATPEFTAPSSLTAQVLEFRVQAQDSEGATSTDTVTVSVAALEENEILSTMETLDFELVTQGNIVAYKGRSNREVMQLKPSSSTGIVTAGGYLDLSNNGIRKIEIIASGKTISNEGSDSIKVDGTKILARLGDLDIPTLGRDSVTPTFMIVLYVGSDTRGLVAVSNATPSYKPLSYRATDDVA